MVFFSWQLIRKSNCMFVKSDCLSLRDRADEVIRDENAATPNTLEISSNKGSPSERTLKMPRKKQLKSQPTAQPFLEDFCFTLLPKKRRDTSLLKTKKAINIPSRVQPRALRPHTEYKHDPGHLLLPDIPCAAGFTFYTTSELCAI